MIMLSNKEEAMHKISGAVTATLLMVLAGISTTSADEFSDLIDLSQSGEQTCLDAIKAASGPIAITHSGCRSYLT